MAKQKKKSKKKIPKSKTGKSVQKNLIHLKLNPDMPSEHFGLDFFHFWNGDTYVGSYKATIDKKLTREGNGKYFTDDGSSYGGLWLNDELSETVKINFKDGISYTGQLLNGLYNGRGVYTVPGMGTFYCDFVDCKPLGVILFEDIDNHKWQGNADSSGISIRPKNHFFYSEEVIKESIESERQQNLTDVTDTTKETEENQFKNSDDMMPVEHNLKNI